MSNPPVPLSDPALAELREFYNAGDLVLFVGAGLSAAAGLPSWKQLVKLAIEHARARGDSAPRITEMETLLGRNELIDALSVAHELFGGSEFGTFVDRHLDDQSRPLPPAVQALSKLGPRLRVALTTNLDHLLERALSWPALHRAQADLVRRRRFIFKLHGTLLDRSSWVFTRAQYDRAIWADPLLRATFSAFFQAWPLLFVGFGLNDDHFETILSQVRALSGDQPPRHFALMAQGEIEGFRRTRIEKAGVRIIEYPNTDKKHSEVAQVLEWLASSPHP
jgi:hypothetical protein